MKKELEKEVDTINLRDTLKEIMQNELKQLPKTLNELEPAQRLNIVCKLIPYVFPKIESIHYSEGEPVDWDFKL